MKSSLPALLFLPGLLNDSALWRHQIKEFEGDYSVQVGDLTVADSMEALAASVLKKAPAKFTLIGLSMGGYVALEIMRQAPERVERLVLMDTSARPDNLEQKRRRRGLIELSNKGKFKGVTPRLLPMLISEKHLQDKKMTQEIMDMAERVGKEAFIRQQTAIMGRADSRPTLAKIKVPTLMVVGAEDAITPPELAHEIADGIKGAKLEVVEESGHLSPLEQPEAVNKLLGRWLRS